MSSNASSQRSRSASSNGWKAALSARVAPWILYLIAMLLAGLASAFVTGCAGRTVLVPEAAPVRLGPDVCARVYARVDGEWLLSPNKVPLQEGWYLVPPSFVEE